MRIRYHAAGNRWPKTHKFRLPSEWQPGPTECNDLEDFFESLKLELSKIPYRKVKPNYSSNEKKAWEALKGDPEIILKPYDKGRGIAVISKTHYLEEGYRQLGMKEQYMKLDYNPTTHTADMLHNLDCKMYLDEQIDRSLAEYLDPHNGQMRTPVFFMLPKVHKTPSRGAFCRKTSGFELFISTRKGFRTHRLLPLTGGKIPTNVPKDTGDTIKKVENIQLPNDIILASFDVVSIFTSVPQDEAFRTTLETLPNLDPFDYNPVIPDEEYIGELLRLVLYKNSLNLMMNIFSRYQVSPWARSLQVASAT